MQRGRNDLPQVLSDTAHQRQLQQLRIGMFDDMKPIPMMHPATQRHGQLQAQPAEYANGNHAPGSGTLNASFPQPLPQFQHQSGMKAHSHTNSMNMSLRHQQQASHRQGLESNTKW